MVENITIIFKNVLCQCSRKCGHTFHEEHIYSLFVVNHNVFIVFYDCMSPSCS